MTESSPSIEQSLAAVQAFLDALRDAVRPSLSCDVGAARLLVIAGALASIANAKENLRRIERSDVRSSLQRRLDDLECRAAPETGL